MTESTPRFESIVEEIADQYPLKDIIVRTETVEKTGEIYGFTLTLNFPGGVPILPYSDDRLTVDIGGTEAVARLEPVAHQRDYWFSAEIPHVNLGSVYEGELRLHQSRLETLLDEITISAERIQALSQGIDKDENKDLFQYISISSFDERTENALTMAKEALGDESDHSEKVSNERLHLMVCLNSPHHLVLDGIDSQWRFNHVDSLRVDGESYPVTMETCLVDDFEEWTGGQMIHTSEFLAEHTDVEKMNFAEEIQKIDLDGLLHGESPWPDSPVTW